LVNLNDSMSLAVHPVQLYQVIGCLIIAFLVWKKRNHWKSNGNLFIFSVLYYATLRFFIEFIRDPDSSFVLVNQYYGMKAIQWILLAVLITGILILTFRELNCRKDYSISTIRNIADFRLIIISGILSFSAIIGKNWFTNLELLTITIFLTPVTIAVVVQIYRNHTAPGFRWVAPLVFMGGCMFMAQTTIPTEKDKDKIKFTELGFNGIFGRYHEELSRVQAGGCGNIYQPIGSQEKKIYQGGIDVSHNMWRSDNYKFKIGARLFVGHESADMQTDYPSCSIYGISPYFNFDWHSIGLGGGFSVGQMKLVSFDRYSADHFSAGQVVATEFDTWHFIPAISFRLGPYDIFYLETVFPGMFPSSLPYANYQLGFGTGLGKKNGTKVAMGICDKKFYSELVYPIKEKYVLNAFYSNNFSSGDKAESAFSIGINFRFPSKKTNESNRQN
jgi:hypothetical protein